MKGVIIYKIPIAHQDKRRKIMPMFNGEFIARQIKILDVKKGNTLGNHYHRYKEIRYLLKGRVQYYLLNIATGEKDEFIMEKGQVMITDGFIAHTGTFLENSIMIEGTEEQYINAKHNDVKWELKT
jgi:dTDP-4-dehydrorhamnose 3,5-epimerase-like enzyme